MEQNMETALGARVKGPCERLPAYAMQGFGLREQERT